MVLTEYDVVKDRERAFRSGIEEGREAGREIGVKEGREIGVKEGRKIGVAEGREIGVAEGRKIGIAEGRAEGRVEGYQDAFLALKDSLLARNPNLTPAEAEAEARKLLNIKD